MSLNMKMGPRKTNGNKSNSGTSSSIDYFMKRARNNEAVKRSREKSRKKANDTHDRVGALKKENAMLEERIELLSKELTFLKDIFMAHAGVNHGLSLDDLEIKSLLKENDNDEQNNNPSSHV